MQEEPTTQSDVVTPESPMPAPVPVPVAAGVSEQTQPAELTAFRKVERVTAWVLIISAVLFAVIGIAAIWGAFGDNGDVVWRALGSLSVIALAALVINVGARMAENRR